MLDTRSATRQLRRVHVSCTNARGIDPDDALRRLQLRCIRELREAEVDGAPGAFIVTAEVPWALLCERIAALADDEFAHDRRGGSLTPAKWFELSPL